MLFRLSLALTTLLLPVDVVGNVLFVLGVLIGTVLLDGSLLGLLAKLLVVSQYFSNQNHLRTQLLYHHSQNATEEVSQQVCYRESGRQCEVVPLFSQQLLHCGQKDSLCQSKDATRQSLQRSLPDEVAQVVEADTHISHQVVMIAALLPAFETQWKFSQRPRVLVPLMGNSNDFIVKQRHGQLPLQLHHYHYFALQDCSSCLCPYCFGEVAHVDGLRVVQLVSERKSSCGEGVCAWQLVGECGEAGGGAGVVEHVEQLDGVQDGLIVQSQSFTSLFHPVYHTLLELHYYSQFRTQLIISKPNQRWRDHSTH